MAAVAVKFVVVVVEVAGVCQVSVESENQIMWEEVFDVAEALGCVLVRGSSLGWVGSEGRSLDGWWRLEAG